MSIETLLMILALGTLAAFAGFAFVSRKRVRDRREDPEAPKSTLAADAPDQR
ncbi:MAG: hypothetical protein ACE37J_05925 [Pikeienuella sp.]|uniref:hypothetical protein n=1 Tax=Pikeienuella sp. TaxID=2831957 RepID=UPI00391B2007